MIPLSKLARAAVACVSSGYILETFIRKDESFSRANPIHPIYLIGAPCLIQPLFCFFIPLVETIAYNVTEESFKWDYPDNFIRIGNGSVFATGAFMYLCYFFGKILIDNWLYCVLFAFFLSLAYRNKYKRQLICDSHIDRCDIVHVK